MYLTGCALLLDLSSPMVAAETKREIVDAMVLPGGSLGASLHLHWQHSPICDFRILVFILSEFTS